MGSETPSRETTIPCRDGFGRQRFAVAFLNDTNDVVLQVPPGECAVWHPGDIPRVQEVLRRLAAEGVDRRDGRG